MKNKFLHKFAKGISIIALATAVYAYGCADGWWGSYNSVFSPEVTVNKNTYSPLFYDQYNLFYTGDARSNHQFYEEENITEWKKYLGKLAEENTISYYLYDDAVTDNLTKWTEQILQGKKPHLPMPLDVTHDKVKNFFAFLSIARGHEAYTNQKYNYWNYDKRQQLQLETEKVQKVEKYYENLPQSDSFFKNRIWFQTMRLKFYSDDVLSAILFFEKTAQNQPKNTLYYRALHYVAGAYKAQGNYEKANGILAQLFDEFPLLQHAATFEYRPMTDKQVKKMTKNLSEQKQAALWAMQGYYSNAMTAMQEIYQVAPSSPHIDFLLARYVNILENKVNIYGDTWEPIQMKSIEDYRKRAKNEVNAKEIEWIHTVAQQNTVSNPYLWNLASGYLASMMADFTTAQQFYNRAQAFASSDVQKEQWRLLNLMNEVARLDKIDDAAETRLYDDIHWLYYSKGAIPYYPKDNMREYYATQWCRQYLSLLYKEKNDPVMAELTFSKRGLYKDAKQSIAMEKFFLNTQKSRWQQLWEGIYEYNLADIYESRAIYLFYQNKIDEAIVEYEKIPVVTRRVYNWNTRQYDVTYEDYKIIELPGNPFNGKIKDCNDCDHYAKQKVKYNGLTFLKKVKEMQDKIAKGEDVYNNALLVGNAFYNASYFGNARAFYYNAIIGEYGNYISSEHQQYLLGMDWVKKYYEIAQKAASTKEEKAKMAYMLAKVERNEFYNSAYFKNFKYSSRYDDVMFKKWKGFEELQNLYSDTQYYQDVIAECGYFRKYLGLQ